MNQLTQLYEITFSDAHTVDREAGVIRGVKVLGRTSRNGREYSDRALCEAARCYQGIGVNLNHPERSQTSLERPVEAGFGWLEDVEVKADGVYGDLYFFKSHAQAAVIVEAAERNPQRFGLSHNAEGKVVRKRGKNVVESVERVRSVDIVQNPATSAGLFESEEPKVQKTIRQIFSESPSGAPAALLEDAEVARRADDPVEVADEADGDDQVAAAFKSMIGGVLDDEGLDLKTKLAKIRAILKAQHKLTAEGHESDDEPVKTPPVAESAPGPVSGDPAIQQLIERLERVETDAACRALLESHNRACDRVRLKALAALDSEELRIKLIESWPERSHESPGSRRPRPAASRPLVESEAVLLPKDAKALAAALR